MKKIFLKQYNALFDEPIVREPHPLDTNDCLRTVADFEDYSAMIEAYNKWLQSKIEIVGEHHFEDNQVVVEGVDYKLHPFTPQNKWVAIPINLLNRV